MEDFEVVLSDNNKMAERQAQGLDYVEETCNHKLELTLTTGLTGPKVNNKRSPIQYHS